MFKFFFLLTLLSSGLAWASETEKATKEQKARKPAADSTADFEFKTMKIANKTVVCGYVVAVGETRSAPAGSGAGAGVSCVVVDGQ